MAAGRLDPGPATCGARPASLAGLHPGRGRDAGARARRDRGHLQHRGRGAAPPAAVPPAGSAGLHRRHRARVRSAERVRPPARVLPPVPGRLEAAPGARALRRLHQHPARGRPRRAGADGDLLAVALSHARGRARARPPAARRGRGPGRPAQLRPVAELVRRGYRGDRTLLPDQRQPAHRRRRDGSGVPLPAGRGHPLDHRRSCGRPTSCRAASA